LIIMMSENKFSTTEFDDADGPGKSDCIIPAENWDTMLWRKACFEGRKRRPQDRWRKKHSRGKRKPTELFFLKGSQARGGCA